MLQEDLLVAATLLLTCSYFWISLRPELKILWHLPCLLSFGMIVILPKGKICSLSLLDEPVNEVEIFWNDTPAMKSPMVFFQSQQWLLLLFSESNENSKCVWSIKPHLVIKQYRLWCYPLCSFHSLRYGNAEDQSCLGIVASHGLSELMEVDKMLRNHDHILLLGAATGLRPEFKVLINQPLTVVIPTSFSTATFHSLQIQKMYLIHLSEST
ncbi:hypothetical protein Rs2_09407 [Raphanus sativus]|nr:hypothetical protein Rs2_09407 [Raphanus sativus]